MPCSQCRIACSPCEPILSRRGRHRKLPLNSSFHLAALSTARDSQNREPGLIPDHRPRGKIPYVVDASNISYLIREFGSPDQTSTPIEECLNRAIRERLDQPTRQHVDSLRSSTLRRLKNEKAFDLPSQAISTVLLDVFFQNSLSALASIEKSDFMDSIQRGTVSHLLLNAVYMVATIYCPDSIINDAGFASRYIASLTFYHRAKDLYDAGHETDAIAVIQATFLLSQWWSGPLEQKDPWYWLGITTGMAQSLENHTRTLNPEIAGCGAEYDIYLSMGLDRAPHVHDNFCEIPTLTADDFQGASAPGEQVPFMISHVQLARTVFEANFLERISAWATLLPYELQFPSKNISGILTQLTYDQYQLLFLRKGPDAAQMGPGSRIFEICTRLFRMLEDLVTGGILFSVAGHVLPAVMSSLCFHIANISRGQQIRPIAEHRARFCLHILKDLQASWPIIASNGEMLDDTLLTHYQIDQLLLLPGNQKVDIPWLQAQLDYARFCSSVIVAMHSGRALFSHLQQQLLRWKTSLLPQY
ncbi:hypothetical protein ASPZODRAFT_20186 [Penicilliopsis zonata CBS 506.65]|uniref:Xylanolytic transcriptional activator regulatory domain-containing protein n=1 Tax=Penicilliopsis zonata CBS 506.65 TaxID=1073090 RepID=A0A1L9S666_9EURO|nr:hypothetical protein ASPZODRAFT_20186 [Penicilliopsis zonata CBS 506.65]OJJ42659.1 hypothetical protein ASPZODRAFT_20186 [Penicilliopsis zonata CBS 506.65]